MAASGPLPEEEFWGIYHRVPRLTVEVVLSDERGVLLTRRAIEPCRGMWHLPGGTVRFGERLTEAVSRVARDELGIEIAASALAGCVEYPSHWENGLDHPVGIAFRVSAAERDPRVGPDAVEHGWFRRLPAGMHREQVDLLVGLGLAAAPPTAPGSGAASLGQQHGA
jgi:ADP-ribose pyrophosphatase YjhB (NUDIX family)